MVTVPAALHPLVANIAGVAFTRPTFQRFCLLMAAMILTTGRRTTSNVLRTVAYLAPGHWSTYHRIFCRRRWSLWELARALTVYVVKTWCPEGRIRLVGDETVESHPGKRVYGKGRHRDAVRSTHSYTAFRWGHKWVVLSILVKFPFATRGWALPVLVALYRSPDWDERHGKRHRTPNEIMQGLLTVMLRWFPGRSFSFTGDGGYGTHAFASFAARHSRRLLLISRFPPDANIFDPPPPKARGHKGRPRIKGHKKASPSSVVKRTKQGKRMKVSWYGGGDRIVEVITGTGCWYKSGRSLVPVLWVYVRDCTGTHRDEYFFTTDSSLRSKTVIESYTGRWSLETTFQDLRAHLGLESTRCWTRSSVLRVAPCIFGLFTFVSIFFASIPAGKQSLLIITWPGKTEPAFSDAICSVRRWLWLHWIFESPGFNRAFAKTPGKIRAILLTGLAPAS